LILTAPQQDSDEKFSTTTKHEGNKCGQLIAFLCNEPQADNSFKGRSSKE